MTVLFDIDKVVISKHLKNVYNSGELIEVSACAIFAHMGNDGKQTYQTKCDSTVYHIGASLKDLGKKLFAFSKMGMKDTDIYGYKTKTGQSNE